MGLFGGLGKTLKKIDWDRVSTGLSAAGASAHGDHGTAAQIWAMHQKKRQDMQEREAKTQTAEQAVAALVRQGIPEADARVLVQTGAADQVLAGRYGQSADSEFVRTLKMAGIDPASPEGQALARQRANTMAMPAPQMIGSPETGYRWVTPPAPGAPAPSAPGGPQPGAVVNGYKFKGGNPNDPSAWEQDTGGGAGNGVGGFPGFSRLGSGWSRFP
jgi:hypothetical protein